jgi:pimeloyl-ACP methyl ester carboxylesterase
LDLLDALALPNAILAGFDWGARSACIVAALWTQRVRALVSCCGYLIQDLARAGTPADPEQERRFWYQYYFNTERGRAGLATKREALCRFLWESWSSTWNFDEATFAATARSFDNPDFVEVAVHSYRHRLGTVLGDPRYAAIEEKLTALPPVDVPTITVHGSVDGVIPVTASEHHARHFTHRHEGRIVMNVGHNVPQEAPGDFAQAILDLCE